MRKRKPAPPRTQKQLDTQRENIRRRRLDPEYRKRESEYGKKYLLKNKEKKDSWQKEYRIKNKEILREKRLKKYRENPEKYREIARRHKEKYPERILATNLRAKYGIGIDDWYSILAKSDGKCMICSSDKHLRLDHCHDSGRVRGALCHRCNIGIGMFDDNPDALWRAVCYLIENSNDEN